MVKISVPKLLLAAAACAAVLCLHSPASFASGGNQPWCAVIDYGDGGVSWECVYRTFEECYPNVIAGNKGSCNVSPYGPGPQPALAVSRRHLKRHAQH